LSDARWKHIRTSWRRSSLAKPKPLCRPWGEYA